MTTYVLDDNWNQPMMTFFDNWEALITKLEELQGKEVDEDQKRDWLTTTLTSNSEFDSLLKTAQVEENITGALAATGKKRLDWDQFWGV